MKQIKIEFEWWWLWIPVLLVTAPQLTKDHTVIAGATYSTLFALALMGIFLRPRKPKVIYSHFNSMLRRAMGLMSIFVVVIVGVVVWIVTQKIDVPDWFDWAFIDVHVVKRTFRL